MNNASLPIENSAPEEPRSFSAAVKRGAFLLAAMRVSTRFLTALQLLIFSIIMGTEDTGLIGIALTTLITIEVFCQLGITKALIQRQGDNSVFFPTAFTAQAIRGTFIAIMMYYSAPWVARWFNAPEAADLLRWFAIIPCCKGFINIAVTQFERKLQFGKVVILDIGSPIIDFIVTMICLFTNPNLFSLVWGKIAGAVWAVAVSYLMKTDSCKLGWNWERFRELHVFGKWVFVSGVIGLLLTRGADFAVGRILSTSEFGILTLSTMLAITPMMELNNIINRVAFPAYSRLQGDIPRLASAFLRTFLAVTTVVVAIMLIIMLSAADLVNLLFDSSWQEMKIVIPLMAIWGACRALGGATSSVFMAVGKPFFASYYHLVMLFMLAVLVYPMTSRGGLIGVSLMLASIGMTVQALRYGLIAKLLDLPAIEIYQRAFIPFCLAGLSWLIVKTLIQPIFADLPSALTIAIFPAVGLSIYLLGLFAWQSLSKIPVYQTLGSVLPLGWFSKFFAKAS